ncbi:hypothetical protein AO398_08250 [Methylobacterium sp. GXS13]|jgi:hypothetical protein|uniref:hypothetical protein n=1 Tax=unclassified Methylobacterium TaxID=2615210 RepID=UPI00071BA8AD|nr:MULTISPECIES: hypothetical protein [unclassified Methylobacterium]KST57431.1 hypothetical protein AO398_08250 [Methylobacterium sp. GXS13]MCJ2117791.1 hypothetical protein [Methylobacterium sp. J-001]
MRIVAINHAESLWRRPWDDTPDTQVVDTLSDELRAHYGPAADEVPAEILALALRLDGMDSERVFAA